jgi:hypothetical protein
MADKEKTKDGIYVVLLLVLSFSIAFAGSTLLIGLLTGKTLPEIFYAWSVMWVSIWDSLRDMLDEFTYDIFGG